MTLTTTTAVRFGPPAPARSFWQRRLFDPLAQQLTQGISPEKLALSVAAASLCAFFPILGAATPLCVAAGLCFRLNQPVIQLVNCLTSPLYLPVVFGFVRVGDVLLGGQKSELKPQLLADLLRHHPAQFLARFGALAGHAVAGWLALAPFWLAAVYLTVSPLLRLGAVRFASGRRGRPANGS